MKHPDAYDTIEVKASAEFKDRGSKFIGVLVPCSDEDHWKSSLDQLRKEHPQARHVCSAMILDASGQLQRSNDDGEPSGSAGLPILNQLKSAELRCVALYVVRYFGGTKLGKSGLVNAYKSSAKLCIDQARIVQRMVEQELEINFHYDRTGEVMRSLDHFTEARIISQTFDQACSLRVAVPKSEAVKALHLFDHTDEVSISLRDI
jgi:uncharacterized YigZ family protein